MGASLLALAKSMYYKLLCYIKHWVSYHFLAIFNTELRSK